mgnify:CR=1 FL=1
MKITKSLVSQTKTPRRRESSGCFFMSFFTILIFLLSSLTLRAERDERNEHLFHRDAAVLEGVAVVLYVVVVVVGVSKEAITRGKDV